MIATQLGPLASSNTSVFPSVARPIMRHEATIQYIEPLPSEVGMLPSGRLEESVFTSANSFASLEFAKIWRNIDSHTSSFLAAPVYMLELPTPTHGNAGHARMATAAQDGVRQIKTLSGLTNEEIAPLVGVSRRSLQAWVAGDPISAKKEERLRNLIRALSSLAGPDVSATRRRLLDRQSGELRPYDLLIEGRFDEALHLALGRRQPFAAANQTQSYGLDVQLDLHEGRVELLPARPNGRFAGRLRR